MIRLDSSIFLRLASFQIVALLTVSVGDLFAIQIAPNPNPEGNTITIAPPIPGDNFVPYTNLGVIRIQAAASFQNANRFDNLGGILNAGRMTNSDVFNNNVVVNLLDGSHFHNQSTGVYSGSGGTGGNGTFLNEGSVSNTLMGWHVLESGQYIQRQGAGSLVTPSTVMRDGIFTNEGQVSLGGGNFVIEKVAGYDNRATGTTQIDAPFQNISGRVSNAGAITIGPTGEYHQQGGLVGPVAPVGGLAANSGTFTNAGTTNIGTGFFDNQVSVVNTGTFTVAAPAQLTGNGTYVQTASAAQTIVHGSFSNALQLQAGSVSGSGIITGHVTQTGGLVEPGTVRPGVLTLASGLTQGFNGRLDFKIGGLLAGSQYDVLRVTGGSLTLNGTLSASLIDGFKPGLGNRFDLLTCTQGCSGLTGGSLFSRLALPSLSSGLAWVTGLTSIGDGVAFSLSVVSPVVSAPEPATLLLVGSGFIGIVAWRQKRRHQQEEG